MYFSCLVYKGARLVSYDDVAEEEEDEGEKEKVETSKL